MEGPSTSPHAEHTRIPSNRSPLSSSRCTQCNLQPKGNGRNLVVCIDGTSNQFGERNTNVVKLFAKINQETSQPEQFAYYSSGIGTSPKSLRIIERVERAVTDKFGMAIAWNIEEIVREAYSWLAQKYQEGDQIYLFGFSRGAYQVRVLAGMIYEVGLIRTPTDKQIGTAYDHYESIRSGKPDTKQIARKFKNTFSWEGLGVHFVGVWDTVSSVGLIRGDVFLSTSSSASHACHFRHALALDERRVKFLPEYFHEMNQQTEDVEYRYIISPDDRNKRTSTGSDDGTHSSKDKGSTDIKEVWFAGSHSDVGGTNRPGKSHQAGNASLLWMRREAVAYGLALKPTDVVWVPDDIDFGVNDSMSPGWAAVEYLPIRQQVSFSGTGKNKRRLHRSQPRRIIPGQKIHASVLYANAYRPLASSGGSFDTSVVQSEPEKLDHRLWETGLFDDSAVETLVDHLSNPQGVAPIYLDRLLFLLRFEEGKQYLKRVRDWKSKFTDLIQDTSCDRLVRLVAIIAYYEASCNPEARLTDPTDSNDLSQDVTSIAKECLEKILAKPKPQESSRVVSLLRPLTKHSTLRKQILTEGVLGRLGTLLDNIFTGSEENFGLTMDGLNCLLECEDPKIRETCAQKLEKAPVDSNSPRLSLILKGDRPHDLTAALRVVLTLARIPEGKSRVDLWKKVKPRIRELASQKERLVGLLAVEILLALYDPTDPRQLNIRNANVRANLASALVSLNTNRHEPTSEQGRSEDPRRIFRDLFGMDGTGLSPEQNKRIAELKLTVKRGDTRERTAATMTLVNLWETPAIRTYLRNNGTNLLDVFVSQLRRRDSALHAAHAIATCLEKDKSDEMKQYVKSNDKLPVNITYMLRWDYFDDAVGPFEGFQIFGDLMQNDVLRKKVMAHNITNLLEEKLKSGNPNETRTGLICLQIFRSFDEDSWTEELVRRSVKHLRGTEWKTQKAGVTVLSALAQTRHGVEIIKEHVHKIAGILAQVTPESPTLQSQTQRASTTTGAPSSCMMGPACVLRILAQNKTLRDHTRGTEEYNALKDLHLSGRLVGNANTSPLSVLTPNRDDVINMLDKMIKAVDGELLEDDLMSIGDTVLPYIQHWDRLEAILWDETVKVASVLPLLGASILAILALVAIAPIYVSVQGYRFLRRLRSHYLDNRFLRNNILNNRHTSNPGNPQVGSAPAGDGRDGEDPSGVHGESSRG